MNYLEAFDLAVWPIVEPYAERQADRYGNGDHRPIRELIEFAPYVSADNICAVLDLADNA